MLVARSGLRGAWFLGFEGHEGRQKVVEPYRVGCWCVVGDVLYISTEIRHIYGAVIIAQEPLEECLTFGGILISAETS